MRSYALLIATFVVGCSSSSGSTVDASTDVVMTKHDAGHDAKKDTAAPEKDAGTVCSPAPVDAGSRDATADVARDAAPDATDAAAKADVDAGPIHCTQDIGCPGGDICDTAKGECVVNFSGDGGFATCSSPPATGADGGGIPGKCGINAADLCCGGTSGCTANPALVDAGPLPKTPIPLPPTDPCCPGAAGDTYCQGKLSDDMATCTGYVCTTCADTCVRAHLAAYQKFLEYQLTDCGCTANGACYSACHDATSAGPGTECGDCLAAQTAEDLSSTCTLAAAGDCTNDPNCTAYQECAGACPM